MSAITKEELHDRIIATAEQGVRDALKQGFEIGFDNAVKFVDAMEKSGRKGLAERLRALKAEMMSGLFETREPGAPS